MSQGKLRLKYPTSVNHNAVQSCLILLGYSFHFNLAEPVFLKQIFGYIILDNPKTQGKNICVPSSHLLILGHPFQFQISDS